MPQKKLPLLAGAAVLALAAPAVAQAPRPEVLPLPTGYQPEGIAKYDGDEVLVGSIPTGALTRVDVQDGTRTVLSPPAEGRSAIGVKVRDGLVFVAGGGTGKVRIQDATTGAVVREEQAGTPGATFVNDVVVSGDRAYFTDSRAPRVYVLPIDGGPLETLTIGGEFAQTGPAGTNNLNGIVARGEFLIAVSRGQLYRIEKATGEARKLTLEGAPNVDTGDGLLLEGTTLSVVQNRMNKISQWTLSDGLLTATLQRELTDPDFAVPTTVTRVQGLLYAPNAKFGVATPASTPYEVVKVGGSQR